MNNKPLRLLILTDMLIIPPISGGAMRIINPFLKLSEKGEYEITYLFQYWSNENIDEKKRYFSNYPNIEIIGVQRDAAIKQKENDLDIEYPIDVINSINNAYLKELERLLSIEEFDLIQVEHSWMSWIVPLIRIKTPNIPVILDMHNIEATYLNRWIPYTEENNRANMSLRYQLMQKWEKEIWSWYDACLAVSPIEKLIFEQNTQKLIQTWELPTGGGIDLDRFPWPVHRDHVKKNSILCLGTMGWSANTHGLTWFIDNVMPILKTSHPKIHLYLGGYGIPDKHFIDHIKDRKDITFLGEVEEEKSLFDQCEIFIVPLWIGAGARVKIPTAWAAGIPIVSTTIGAEGLNYTDGKDIMIADEPATFAEKILYLLDNPSFEHELTENGRALVENKYSLQYAVKMYDEVYKNIFEIPKNKIDKNYYYLWIERNKAIRLLLKLKAYLINLPLLPNNPSQSESIPYSVSLEILVRLNKITNLLFPLLSKRRRLFILCFTGIKVIMEEGWIKFFSKMQSWLRRKFKKQPRKENLTFEEKYKNTFGSILSLDNLINIIYSKAKRGNVIYDVGSYHGAYSIYLAQKIPNSLVYSFEPTPATYNSLVNNINKFQLSNIVTKNVAISDTICKKTFHISSDAARSSFNTNNALSNDNKVLKSIEIDCLTIDSLIESGASPPDIIKIDTEGHEFEVLKGAEKTIRKFMPIIFYEPHPKDDGASEEDIISKLLGNYGYCIKSLGYPFMCYKKK
jgi:polysaccharide biosynthesis protein PslH